MRGHKQYFVEFESDKFDKLSYNHETDDYGSYIHFAGNASTLKSAKSVIRNARKNPSWAADHPRNFKVYDCWADIVPETNHVPCVYFEA